MPGPKASTPPMSHDDVLATLRKVGYELDTLLAQLDEADMTEVAVHGEWTVKDVLAHLAAWEGLEAGWIEAVLAGETPLLYAPGFEWDPSDWQARVATIHRYNAHVLKETQKRSLDDVLADFRSTQQRMHSLIEQLPERALADPEMLFWLAVEVPREPWMPVPVNSYEHYIDHTAWLRTWMEQGKP